MGNEKIIANPSNIIVTSGFLPSSPLGKAIIIGGITERYKNIICPNISKQNIIERVNDEPKILIISHRSRFLSFLFLYSITYRFPIFISDHLQFHKDNINLHSVAMTIIVEQWNYN